MRDMRNIWAERLKELNKDAKSNATREEIKISLTDKEYNELKFRAYKAGFNNAGELISSFVGDLTGWFHTNGSDERDLAEQWYNCALGFWYNYFRFHLFNYDYDLDTLKDMLEDSDLFEDVYKEYADKYDGKNIQNKEDCLAELKKIVETGKAL